MLLERGPVLASVEFISAERTTESDQKTQTLAPTASSPTTAQGSMANVGWHRQIIANVLVSPESEGPAGRYTLCRRSATAGSRPQLNFLRPAGPTHRDGVSESARPVSPNSGLSRIKGKRTGGRGPPAMDVSAHSGLEHLSD